MKLRPPDEMVYTGQGDFEKIGRQWVEYFFAHCGLRPHESVLDVGSGIGRVAIPLTDYLTGRYEGLDVVRSGVDWCSEHITTQFPNFRFQLADISNGRYNPEGDRPAAEYRFPYEDEEFDFVFLISVFTHMLPAGVMRYVDEIARVLRPGGRCLASALLLNETSLANLSRLPPQLRLDCVEDFYRYNSGDDPEDVLAYDEEFLLDVFRERGFTPTVDYGFWGRPAKTNPDHQDVVLGRKRA